MSVTMGLFQYHASLFSDYFPQVGVDIEIVKRIYLISDVV